MEARETVRLGTVHDLAVLYLALTHGTDQRLEQEEQRALARVLRHWLPDRDPALIDHMIREATLSYMNGLDAPGLEALVDTLARALTMEMRRSVLDDLMALAAADHEVRPEEQAFVAQLAKAWHMDPGRTYDA